MRVVMWLEPHWMEKATEVVGLTQRYGIQRFSRWLTRSQRMQVLTYAMKRTMQRSKPCARLKRMALYRHRPSSCIYPAKNTFRLKMVRPLSTLALFISCTHIRVSLFMLWLLPSCTMVAISLHAAVLRRPTQGNGNFPEANATPVRIGAKPSLESCKKNCPLRSAHATRSVLGTGSGMEMVL